MTTPDIASLRANLLLQAAHGGNEIRAQCVAVEVADGLGALPRAAYAGVKDQLRGATVAELARIVEHDPMLGEWVGEEAVAASSAILDSRKGST